MSELATSLVFWPAAVLMLVTALYVFITPSMARAGLLLLASLAIMGLIFLSLSSEFLGLLTLLMMSAEMVIMAFYMIMFMPDPGGLMGMDMVHEKRRSASVAAGASAGLAIVAILTDWPARAIGTDAPDVRAIGFEVMGRSMVTFLFAAMTILFAMVGSVLLARHGGRFGIGAPAGEDRGVAD